jgi:hypothetical protein
MEYVASKEGLPEQDRNAECYICGELVDLDGMLNSGIPNCVMCENGHRIHRSCYDNMMNSPALHNKNCFCGEPFTRMCSSSKGYGYVPRKGGKRTRKNVKKIRKMKKRGTKRFTRK